MGMVASGKLDPQPAMAIKWQVFASEQTEYLGNRGQWG